MKETIEAVYENGVFRPLKPPALPTGQHVRLEIEVTRGGSSDQILALAAGVLEGLTEDQINEVERIALDRSDFFGDRN